MKQPPELCKTLTGKAADQQRQNERQKKRPCTEIWERGSSGHGGQKGNGVITSNHIVKGEIERPAGQNKKKIRTAGVQAKSPAQNAKS